jgi:hypothetical protein
MHAYARLFRCIASLLFVVALSCAPLRADVGLVLYESIGGGINGWTGSGHAALYFSNLCAETPTKLRLCRLGEAGAVVSNYTSLGEDFGYEWNAVPVEVAFYGVSDPVQQPLLAWPALRQALQERYRRSHLPEICAGTRCMSNPEAEWRDLVATTFVRDSYVFLAKTTVAQDAKIMQWLNSSPNVNHYNGFTNNCADFAARVLNTYFPGSARPDHMNDFAITSPKAIAKSLTHYARKHPALQLRVVRFTQIPGTFHASTDAKKGTQALFTSKRWLFPLLLRPHELAFFAGSYLLTGRFNPERELRHQPAAALPHSQSPVPATQPVRKGPSEAVPVWWVAKPAAIHELAPTPAPGNAGNAKPSAAAVLGSSHAWARYAAAFRELTDEAIQKGLITSRIAPRHVVDLMNSDGRIWFDSQGAAWIDFTGEDGTSRRVGLTAGNITSRDSNPRIAYMIMLARVGTMLDRIGKNREPMLYFEQDWDLLLQARARLWPMPELASDFPCCGLESARLPLLEKVSCDGGSNQAALRSAAASSCLSRMK